MDKIRQMLEDLEKELRKDKQYSAADKLLPIIKEAGKDGWIPCSERLPGKSENVLTYREAGDHSIQSLNIGRWEDEYGYWWDLESVVAWMPLPEPYKGE